MHAKIRDRTTGEITKIETEPLSNYNILVFRPGFKRQILYSHLLIPMYYVMALQEMRM
jgi:hypothetical protein